MENNEKKKIKANTQKRKLSALVIGDEFDKGKYVLLGVNSVHI